MNSVEIANHFFSILTVIAQITVSIIIISLFFSKRTGSILQFFGKHALLFSYIVALVATLGSLFYSEIAKYEPCKLCLYQRILMYPQVLILGMAFLKKDKKIANYSIMLSVVGAGIAFYHYMLQRGVVQELVPCATVGYSVSCAEKFVMIYGYITIPLMSLSAFLLILFLFIAQKRVKIKKLS